MYVVGVISKKTLGRTIVAFTLEDGYNKIAELMDDNDDGKAPLDHWVDNCTLEIGENTYFFGHLEEEI